MEGDVVDALVIEWGSESVRAGFAGDDAPRAVFPTIVGRPRHKGVIVGVGVKAFYVGDEAQSKRGILNNRRPFVDGIVNDWDDMECLCHHTFYDELRIAPEEHPLLFIESPLTRKKEKEKRTQIMFETFSVPALCAVPSAEMVMLAAGRSSGVVLELGHGRARAVPVWEGRVVRDAVMEANASGELLTRRLNRMLEWNRGLSFTSSELAIVELCKKQICFVSQNCDNEDVMDEKTFEYIRNRPWGFFMVGSEQFHCPESLFRPDLESPYFGDLPELKLSWQRVRLLWIGRVDCESTLFGVSKDVMRLIERECVGKEFYRSLRVLDRDVSIQEMTAMAISKCAIDNRATLWKNVLLTGGTSLFRGLYERLKKELLAVAPPCMNVEILAPPERLHWAWIGGSKFASQSGFAEMCISKADYDEMGANAVHRDTTK